MKHMLINTFNDNVNPLPYMIRKCGECCGGTSFWTGIPIFTILNLLKSENQAESSYVHITRPISIKGNLKIISYLKIIGSLPQKASVKKQTSFSLRNVADWILFCMILGLIIV